MVRGDLIVTSSVRWVWCLYSADSSISPGNAHITPGSGSLGEGGGVGDSRHPEVARYPGVKAEQEGSTWAKGPFHSLHHCVLRARSPTNSCLYFRQTGNTFVSIEHGRTYCSSMEEWYSPNSPSLWKICISFLFGFVYLHFPAFKTCLSHLEVHTRRETRASNFKEVWLRGVMLTLTLTFISFCLVRRKTGTLKTT